MSYIVDCCNPSCSWAGKVAECVRLKHDTQPLCPECREVVEPRASYRVVLLDGYYVEMVDGEHKSIVSRRYKSVDAARQFAAKLTSLEAEGAVFQVGGESK